MEAAKRGAIVGVVFFLNPPFCMARIHPSLVFFHSLFQFFGQLISDRAGRSFFSWQLVSHLTEVGAIGSGRARQLGS